MNSHEVKVLNNQSYPSKIREDLEDKIIRKLPYSKIEQDGYVCTTDERIALDEQIALFEKAHMLIIQKDKDLIGLLNSRPEVTPTKLQWADYNEDEKVSKGYKP